MLNNKIYHLFSSFYRYLNFLTKKINIVLKFMNLFIILSIFEINDDNALLYFMQSIMQNLMLFSECSC